MIEFSVDARPLVLCQSLHAGPALHSFSYSLVKKLNVGRAAGTDPHLLLGWVSLATYLMKEIIEEYPCGERVW